MRKNVSHLERHHRANELHPIGRYQYKGVDYAVAVGGPFDIRYPTTTTERDIAREHPNGYYEVAFTLLRDDQPWIGGSNIVDKYHDLTGGDRARMRINAARQMAEWAIDNGAKACLERDR